MIFPRRWEGRPNSIFGDIMAFFRSKYANSIMHRARRLQFLLISNNGKIQEMREQFLEDCNPDSGNDGFDRTKYANFTKRDRGDDCIIKQK